MAATAVGIAAAATAATAATASTTGANAVAGICWPLPWPIPSSPRPRGRARRDRPPRPDIPVAKPRRRGVRAGPSSVSGAALAVVAAGAAAVRRAAGAEITVTPCIEDIGPIDVTVAPTLPNGGGRGSGVIPAEAMTSPWRSVATSLPRESEP